MNNFIKKLREKGLKKKIDQFVDTFGAKIDTNIEELNQNNKQKVLNDRKIYKNLVELLSKKYILPEKDKLRASELEERINSVLSGDNNVDVCTLLAILNNKLKQ